MNTGVGSLSLLQGILLTQESNRGLPHCRQILYQLSYQGSPGKIRHVGLISGSGRWRRATHSSILSQRIPWTEEPGRLQSIGSQRVGQNMLSWKGKGNTTDLNILLFKM